MPPALNYSKFSCFLFSFPFFFFLLSAIADFCLSPAFLLISNFLSQAKQNILLGPSILSHVGRDASGIISRPKRTRREAISPSLSPHPSAWAGEGEAMQLNLEQHALDTESEKIQEHWIYDLFSWFQLLMILASTGVRGKLSEATIQIFWARVIESSVVL